MDILKTVMCPGCGIDVRLGCALADSVPDEHRIAINSKCWKCGAKVEFETTAAVERGHAFDKRQVAFMLGEKDGGGHVLLIGLSHEALDQLRARRTQTLDLKTLGLDVQVIFFSEATREQCVAVVKENSPGTLIDMSHTRGYAIKEPK